MSSQTNPYVPFPSKVLEVVRHAKKGYTFRMAFSGDVKPGQFFEVSVPKSGEAPIGVSGIVPGKSVDLTIRRVGRVTNEMFDTYAGQILLLRGPYGNGFDVGRYVDGECVVVAGGAGVSPVRGVIEALGQGARPHAHGGRCAGGLRGKRRSRHEVHTRARTARPGDGAGRGRRTTVHDALHGAGTARSWLCREEHLGELGAQDVLRPGQVRALPHRREVRVPGRSRLQLHREQEPD